MEGLGFSHTLASFFPKEWSQTTWVVRRAEIDVLY